MIITVVFVDNKTFRHKHFDIFKYSYFLAEIQKASVQNDVLGRETTKIPTHSPKSPKTYRLRNKRPSRKNHQNVLKGPGS